VTATAVLAASVILVFAALSTFLITGEFQALLRHIPDQPSEDYKILVTLFGIAAATLTAVLGLLVALWTYRRSSKATRLAQRKQHTITILFETRLSEYFQRTNTQRKLAFPVDQDITLADWRAARTATGSSPQDEARAAALRDGADALQQMLNYYEFLAVGIAQQDLDKDLLKASIRGIMCNLVDDARIMIAELRQNDPKTMEHLVHLYEEWRRDDAINHNGEITERPIPRLPDPR
jgi:hypothetical protein